MGCGEGKLGMARIDGGYKVAVGGIKGDDGGGYSVQSPRPFSQRPDGNAMPWARVEDGTRCLRDRTAMVPVARRDGGRTAVVPAGRELRAECRCVIRTPTTHANAQGGG